ncbi:hypothetical protein C9374_005370 [Naegleria lovaniensis]|uniref:RGS domain-containing protein n=1 Tax=Naegleria lovaniensis TaxID=51637 RepID=A0AA88GQ79_NAELO|nr:uncharacterized protein C9374_005370 [Naegleria lovaniensis]KAG2382168.1 hypothetical protein C9374_005370 [Naegleria lovaniensis]
MMNDLKQPCSSPTNRYSASSSRRKFSLPLFRTKQECEQEALEFASNFMIIFEEMMNNEVARAEFKHFLKEEAHNEEPINFLDDLEIYSKEFKKTNDCFLQDDVQTSSSTFKRVTKLYNQAHKIIEKYIAFQGHSELNLGHSQNSTLREWSKIEYLMQLITSTQEEVSVDTTGSPPSSPKSPTSPLSPTNLFFSNFPTVTSYGAQARREQTHSKPNPKRILYNRDLVRQMMELLDAKQLFESCKVNVNLDLKLDQFPRFTRSKCCHLFLFFNGESFARTIAVDISKGRNVDVRFRPKDFETQLVTDKDIYFAFSMCEDDLHWELVYDSKQIKLFHSKANFLFGKDPSSMHLSKSVMTLPFPVEQIWNAFCHQDFRFKLHDRLLPGSCSLEYIPPVKSTDTDPQKGLVIEEREDLYNSDAPPLGIALGFLGIDAKLPLVKKRVCSISQTCIYDPHAQCYVNVGHSTSPLSHSQQYQDFAREKVVMDLLFCHMFFRVNMNTTRFVQVYYLDHKLPQALSQSIITKQSKTMFENFESTIQQSRCCQSSCQNHVTPSPSLDVFKIQKALDDNSRLYPNRSWFKEYESRKKQTIPPSTDDSVAFPRVHTSGRKSSYL